MARLKRRTLERGSSMVEYAAAVLPFMLLLLGLFDLSRAVLYQHLITNAAREAARHGIAAQRTEAAICTVAVQATAGTLPGVPGSTGCSGAGAGTVSAGGLTVSVTRDPASVATRYVRVQLTYAFTPITPLIASVTGGPVPLASSARMYVEPE